MLSGTDCRIETFPPTSFLQGTDFFCGSVLFSLVRKTYSSLSPKFGIPSSFFQWQTWEIAIMNHLNKHWFLVHWMQSAWMSFVADLCGLWVQSPADKPYWAPNRVKVMKSQHSSDVIIHGHCACFLDDDYRFGNIQALLSAQFNFRCVANILCSRNGICPLFLCRCLYGFLTVHVTICRCNPCQLDIAPEAPCSI